MRIAVVIVSIVLLSGCAEIDLCSSFGICEETVAVKTTKQELGPRDVVTISDVYTIPRSPIPPDNSVLLTFILTNHDTDPKNIAQNVIVDLYDATTFKNTLKQRCNENPSENCRSNQCNNLNPYTPCKLLPTAEKPITFNLISPSEAEIANIRTNPVLSFKVYYDFYSSMLYDVVVVNPMDMIKRQKAGETMPLSQAVIYSSGPIKIDAEIQGEKYALGDDTMDTIIIFTVEDEGSGTLKDGAIAPGKMKIEFPLGLANEQLNNIKSYSTRQQTTGGGPTMVDISGGTTGTTGGTAGTTGGTAGGTAGGTVKRDDAWCKNQAQTAKKPNPNNYECVDTNSYDNCETGTGLGGDSNWCDQSKGLKCCIPAGVSVTGGTVDRNDPCSIACGNYCPFDECMGIDKSKSTYGLGCYWIDRGIEDPLPLGEIGNSCFSCKSDVTCEFFSSPPLKGKAQCQEYACGLIKKGYECRWTSGEKCSLVKTPAEVVPKQPCSDCFIGLQTCKREKCQGTTMGGKECYWVEAGFSLTEKCFICPENPKCRLFDSKDECETAACGLIKTGGECIWTSDGECSTPKTPTGAVVSSAITGMATASKCSECGAGTLEACDLQECIDLGSDCYFAPYSSTVPQYGYCKECPATGALCSLFTLSEMCKANHCNLQCVWAGSSCVAASSATKCSDIKNREQCTLGPLDCHWDGSCKEGSNCNDEKKTLEACHDMGTYCYFDNTLGATDVLGNDGTCRRCSASTSCSAFNLAAECNSDRVCTAKCEMQGTVCTQKTDKISAATVVKPLFNCSSGNDKVVCENIEPIDLYKDQSVPLYFRIKGVPKVEIHETFTIKADVYYTYELKNSVEVEIKPWGSK
ncbi:MAG: hypothetical protein HZB66_01230 [Candidatus Aenigmarchaeota archaeon]|nr:hypothetical protein [Candidatus Aenigmarchaeota archaeon]